MQKVLQGWVKNTIALLRRSIINIFLKFNTVAPLKMPELCHHIWLPEKWAGARATSLDSS